MPKGYIIGDFTMTGHDGMGEYQRVAAERLAAHGGRVLLAGGESRLLEGEGGPGTWVVLEFDSPEAAAGWYNDPAYKAALPIRLRNATGRVALVTGWTPPAP